MGRWAYRLLSIAAIVSVFLIAPLIPVAAGSPPAGTIIENYAQLSYEDLGGALTERSSATVSVVVASGPRLTVAKSGLPDPAAPGQVIHYSIAVYNHGNAQATDLLITDWLPDSIEYVSGSAVPPAMYSVTGRTLTWRISALAMDTGSTFLFDATVKSGMPAGTLINNSVLVSSAEGSVAEDEIFTTVGSGCHPGITKRLVSVEPGGILAIDSLITYEITVSNSGNIGAEGLIVYDPVPDSTQFVSADSGGILVGSEAVWFLDSLAPVSSESVLVTYRLTAAPVGDALFSGPSLLTCSSGAALYSNSVTTPYFAIYTRITDPDGHGVNWQQQPASGRVETLLGEPIAGPADVQEDGTLLLPISAAGTYYLTIEFRSLATSDTYVLPRIVTTTEAGGISSPEEEIVQGSAIIFSPNASPRHPPGGWPVQLLHIASATQYFTSVFGSSGSFVFQGNYTPGEYEVSIEHPDYPGVFVTRTLAILENGQVVTQCDLIMDVAGIVFNGETGAPVPGANITILDAGSGQPVSLPAYSGDGPWPNIDNTNPYALEETSYAFILASEQIGNPGQPVLYHLLIEAPDGYTDRVLALSVQFMGSDEEMLQIVVSSLDGLPVAEATALSIVPGPVIIEGVKVIAPHIPLFAVTPIEGLSLEKQCNETAVSLGDIAHYELIVTNPTNTGTIFDITIEDIPAHGTTYISGSSRLEGTNIPDPELTSNTLLAWNIGDLAPDQTKTLSYALRVGPDAHRGEGINTARAFGATPAGEVSSNTAQFRLRIREGIFTSESTILGTVFVDMNENGEFDPPATSDQECSALPPIPDIPIPGACIYLETGLRIITDRHGRYSVPGVAPGVHVIRLDASSLPSGVAASSTCPAIKNGILSQFVQVDQGTLYKVDFPLYKEETLPGQKADSLQSKKHIPPVTPVKTPAGQHGFAAASNIEVCDGKPIFLAPSEGQVLSHEYTTICIAYSAETEVSLSVNGTRVPDAHIGKTQIDGRTGIATSELFSIALTPGYNTLSAHTTDQFGNLRGEVAIAVYRIGEPHSLELVANPKELPADGKSCSSIFFDILDSQGYRIQEPRTVTVEVTGGTIQGEDTEPWSSGFQLTCADGRGSVVLQSSRQAGPITITLHCEHMSASTQLRLLPYASSTLLVGKLDARVGLGWVDGSPPPHAELPGEEGFFHEEYAGLFWQSPWGQDAVFTLGYNSQGELFQERDGEQEARFPVYGDASKRDYLAQSRGNLYAHLEHRDYSILWGDYQANSSKLKLGAYQRSLHGLKASVASESYAALVFASYTDYQPQHDEIRGQGISGYYYLTKYPLIDESEQVSEEVRSRDDPGHLIRRWSLQRNTDYTVDYDTGALLFRQPIPYEDPEGNPVFIVVDYETEGGGLNRWTFGGWATGELNDDLAITAGGIREEDTDGYRELVGLATVLQMDDSTSVNGEVALTRTLTPAASEPATGVAWRMSLKRNMGSNSHFHGYYQQTTTSFDNPQAQGVAPGTLQYGLGLQLNTSESNKISINHLCQEPTSGAGAYQESSLSFNSTGTPTSYTLSLVHQSRQAEYSPQKLDESSYLDEYDVPELTLVRAKMDTYVHSGTKLLIEYEQGLAGQNLTSIGAGIQQQIDRVTSAYLKAKRSYLASTQRDNLIAGWKTMLTVDTSFYQEYEIDAGISGEDNKHKIGLQSTFTIQPGWKGNISVERVDTLQGDEEDKQEDFLAVAFGSECLRNPTSKWTHRLEFRQARHTQSALAQISLTSRIDTEHTLFGKSSYWNSQNQDSNILETWDNSVGLAYRPLSCDRIALLSKLEHELSQETGNGSYYRQTRLMGSASAVYELNPRSQLRARYAAKLTQENNAPDWNATNFMQLAAIGLTQQLAQNWALDAGYQIVWQDSLATVWRGWYGELEYRLTDDWAVAAGYSSNDLTDNDFATQAYSQRGLYLRMKVKLDEMTFK